MEVQKLTEQFMSVPKLNVQTLSKKYQCPCFAYGAGQHCHLPNKSVDVRDLEQLTSIIQEIIRFYSS